MKHNKFLSIALLSGAFLLSACGSKGVEPTPTGPSYTITDVEYLTLKSKLSSPKIFIDGNFTVDMSMSGVTFKNKIANAKADIYPQGSHIVLDLDVSSYSAPGKANGDTYEYDEDEKTWSKETGEVKVSAFSSFIFGVVEYMPASFDELSYNDDTRFYSGSLTQGDSTLVTKFMVKNGQFLTIDMVGMVTYEFSDYGTTTVTLPEVVA